MSGKKLTQIYDKNYDFFWYLFGSQFYGIFTLFEVFWLEKSCNLNIWKFLCMIWDLVTKTSKIRIVTFTLENFNNVKKNLKSSYGFWNINKFIWNEKKG